MKMTKERGHLEGMSDEQKENLFSQIGMGGLKYFLLKVDPKKRMLFNPEESIELNGNTGPFIQYAHARIRSLLLKAGTYSDFSATELLEEEKELVKFIAQYSEVVKLAGSEFSPAIIANYAYELVKLFNHFYQTVPILIEKDQMVKNMRLVLCEVVADIINRSLSLLGIQAPDKM